MRVKWQFLSFVAILGCVGCVTESVHPTDKQIASQCKLLKTVRGTSRGIGDGALQSAKSDAYQKALKAGATHVVYVGSAQSSAEASAEAQAYRCR